MSQRVVSFRGVVQALRDCVGRVVGLCGLRAIRARGRNQAGPELAWRPTGNPSC